MTNNNFCQLKLTQNTTKFLGRSMEGRVDICQIFLTNHTNGHFDNRMLIKFPLHISINIISICKHVCYAVISHFIYIKATNEGRLIICIFCQEFLTKIKGYLYRSSRVPMETKV